MKVGAISDTHTRHDDIDIPEGLDMIIHAGDFSRRGSEEEAKDFLKWYASLDIEHKILVPGNHDVWVERSGSRWVSQFCKNNGIILLIDEAVEIEGIKFWGSPITPRFGHGWAWNRDKSEEKARERKFREVRGAEFIGKTWDKIPENTDVIITHGPPHEILDQRSFGIHIGCPLLKEQIELIKPKLFICGHVHEARGLFKTDDTLYANVSTCDREYNVREVMLFEL